LTVIFPKWTNALPPVLAAGAVVGLLGAVWFVDTFFSPWHTDVGYAPQQPVYYSHKLHAGLLGMDCRYCHQAVEDGPHATVPATETCMNCHAQIKTTSERLTRVRESYASGLPIPWIKVHMLPDYAYFDHSVHVKAGVGCASCHGRIDEMEVVRQTQPLSMGWCLECHRDPTPHLRPPDQITNMNWEDASHPDGKTLAERLEIGRAIKAERHIDPPTHCSACHR
jgi:hypothetical protein